MPDEARQLRLSPLAVSDLEDIWRYTIKRWSVEQANRYHRDLMVAMQALAAGGKTGRRVDIREGYLKYAVGRHIVYYRLSSSSLNVIRILHQSMDVDRRL